MKNTLGTVTARMVRPYLPSQKMAEIYARFINFFLLFVCLLAGILHVAPECRSITYPGHGSAPDGVNQSFSCSTVSPVFFHLHQ